MEQFGFFAPVSYVFVSVEKWQLQRLYFFVELDAVEEESFVEQLIVAHVEEAVHWSVILIVLVTVEVFSTGKNKPQRSFYMESRHCQKPFNL